MRLNFEENEMWPSEARERDIVAIAGETLNITCVFLEASSVASGSALVYLSNEDVTATVMPSGSVSYVDNAMTLKPITALTGGSDYIVVLTATLDGSDVKSKKIKLVVAEAGEE